MLGLNTVFLLGVYFFARQMSRKVMLVLFFVAITFAATPWFGVGRGVFIPFSGWPRPLPTIDVSGQTRDVLRPIYDVAALPLAAATILGEEFSDFVHFADAGVVRPFVVFVFWLDVALTVFLAVVINAIRSNRDRRQTQSSPPAEQRKTTPAGESPTI